jgi:rsbT co-antagonist protein RsbR
LHSFTPTETATFVFSLKEPLFTLLREGMKGAQQLADLTWTVTKLLDKLGLHANVKFRPAGCGLCSTLAQLCHLPDRL